MPTLHSFHHPPSVSARNLRPSRRLFVLSLRPVPASWDPPNSARNTSLPSPAGELHTALPINKCQHNLSLTALQTDCCDIDGITTIQLIFLPKNWWKGPKPGVEVAEVQYFALRAVHSPAVFRLHQPICMFRLNTLGHVLRKQLSAKCN